MKKQSLFIAGSLLLVFPFFTNAQAQEDNASEKKAFVDSINSYRARVGLPPLTEATNKEEEADAKTKLDAESSSPHGHGSYAQNTCPSLPEYSGYRSYAHARDVCLQMMWNEGPPPTTPCTGDCFKRHGHYINMTNPRYKSVAIGFYKLPNGNVWVNMNFYQE